MTDNTEILQALDDSLLENASGGVYDNDKESYHTILEFIDEGKPDNAKACYRFNFNDLSESHKNTIRFRFMQKFGYQIE